MPRPSSLSCVRCSARYPLDHFDRDCAACRSAGAPANLTVAYDGEIGAGLDPGQLPRKPAGLWRWGAFLPQVEPVTLGEGATPLIAAPKLGLGDVWIKDESRNPTWSFKDRLASGALSWAKAVGAKTIASSSSGNAGAAAAAYAAKAGIPCIVFTFQGASGVMVTQMRAYGAMVVVVADKADRWKLQTAGVSELGWYPTSPFFGPVVGSNPFGIEGYKTIAYEIAEAFDWDVPDWCVLPVCYGDALFGMWKGFEELRAIGWTRRTPRFVAAEIAGSLAMALSTGSSMPPDRPRNEPTLATSIGASQGTVQSLDVLRATDGAAVAIDNDELVRWVHKLAREEGIWGEPSSVAPFPAIERLKAAGRIKPTDRVVALLTASGLKDAGPTEATLPPAPLVQPTLPALLKSLHDVYGYKP